MPNVLRYDPDADAMYVRLSSRHAWETLEINSNLNIDLDQTGRVVGVELLDVRRFAKSLFGHVLDDEGLKNLHIKASTRTGRELVLDMDCAGEHVRYAIPGAYKSPVVSAV
ncbi:MAG: DUF2283 domain-containing protein [Candidatus Micrarchaeota archaeon]